MGDAPLNEAMPETPTSPPVSYKGLDDDMYDFDDDSVEVVTQPVVPSGVMAVLGRPVMNPYRYL